MATYGYSAGYQGGGPQAVPSGYIEAYSQAGRNIGQGMQAIGSAIGESLARYGQNKAENEFLTSRLESLAPYLQTVAQSGNIMDAKSPESKLLGDIEKFSSMSIPQKKATLLNAEFYLDRADKARQREMQGIQTQAALQNLQLGALQLGQAQREAASAPYFTQALGDVMSRQPGQGPTTPYANVTSELLSKYGDKLTPAQMQSLIPLIRKSEQVLPPGLVPTEAKMTPAGLETTYGMTPTVGSQPIPGTDMVQPTVGGKPYGTAQPAKPLIQSKIDELPKEKQEWANSTLSKLRENKSFSDLEARANEYSTLEKIASKPNPSPADDIALIIRFNKTMDPAGAVLEGEFKRSVEGGSVAERVKQYYEYYTAGNRLTPQMRKDIVDAAKSVVESYAPSAAGRINDEVKAAEYRGVPKEAVIPDSMIKFWEKTSATHGISGEERKTTGGVNYTVKRK